MSKKVVWGLILLGLAVVVIVFNSRGTVDVNLVLGGVEGLKALVFLAFTAVGVVVGLLLGK